MTRRAAALLASLLFCVVGCGDPELDLVFSVPAPYGDVIQQVILRIYAPRGASAFDCEGLAYGQVEQGVLLGSQIDEVVLRDDGVLRISALERVSDKIFFAEGLDASGNPVVRGCSAYGEVDGDISVEIEGSPVAAVGLVEAPSLSRRVSEPLDGPITMRVSDVLTNPLPEIDVQWQVVGVNGVAAAGDARTDAAGEISVFPALPAQPGPFLLDVSVRWALPRPPIATGFVAPAPDVITLPGAVREYRSGEVGPGGEQGFVVLLDPGTQGEVQVGFVYRTVEGVQVNLTPRIAGTGARLGLFELTNAPDRAVLVTRNAWMEIAPDGIITPRPSYRPPVAATGAAPKIVLPTGPCEGTASTAQVLVAYEAEAVAFYDLEVDFKGGFTQNLDVLASGCVDDQLGAPIRTLVIDGGAAVGLALAAEVRENLYATRPWVAVGSGTAFSPAVGGAGRLLLGTQLNVNDFVVSRASWHRLGDTLELQMEGVDSPPEIPVANQGGDVDGDGALDVVSLYGVQTSVDEEVGWYLWSALGRTHNGTRMSGAYRLDGSNVRNPALMVLDFDGDGVDDILVADQQNPLAPLQRESRVEVFSMGPAAP